MLNPKHSAKYVCRTGTSASSTARAVTSYEMIRQRTRSTSSQFLTSFRFTTTTSGKSPIGNQKSFTLTIPWNSAKLVKISPGIIARLHHTDRRLMVLLKRAVRRVKEGTSAVLLQSGLNESWWADSMECYTYLRNVTDLLSDGKTPL